MPYINDRTVGKQYVNASVYCNGANIANKGKDDGGRWIFTIHKADIAATSLQGKSVRFEYGNKNAKRFISISDIGHDVEVELR